MPYSVVPRELQGELLERLAAHYADDPEMTVIVDRRQGERRQRRTPDAAVPQRVIRDRRRRRVNGDFAALHGEASLTSTA
ncbi:MAG TPA: hypothetical protein VNC12_01495 [Solirubrobacteraceae bacterium]|nr:hypothetical protein [Solirubrobacteraceae bacterium]